MNELLKQFRKAHSFVFMKHQENIMPHIKNEDMDILRFHIGSFCFDWFTDCGEWFINCGKAKIIGDECIVTYCELSSASGFKKGSYDWLPFDEEKELEFLSRVGQLCEIDEDGNITPI